MKTKKWCKSYWVITRKLLFNGGDEFLVRWGGVKNLVRRKANVEKSFRGGGDEKILDWWVVSPK